MMLPGKIGSQEADMVRDAIELIRNNPDLEGGSYELVMEQLQEDYGCDWDTAKAIVMHALHLMGK